MDVQKKKKKRTTTTTLTTTTISECRRHERDLDEMWSCCQAAESVSGCSVHMLCQLSNGRNNFRQKMFLFVSSFEFVCIKIYYTMVCSLKANVGSN